MTSPAYSANLSQAIIYYKPLVEKKFSEIAGRSVSLGEVQVRDMDCLTDNLINYMYRRTFNDVVAQKGFASFLDRTIAWLGQKVFFKKEWNKIVQNHIQRGDLLWFNSVVYVSYKRVYDSKTPIPLDAVHEICHGVWIELGGEDQFDTSIRNDTNLHNLFAISAEAFALYGEQLLCKDFYPEEIQLQIRRELQLPPKNNYERGRKKIEELVTQHEQTHIGHGQEILLEIPKNWRRLMN